MPYGNDDRPYHSRDLSGMGKVVGNYVVDVVCVFQLSMHA
jgi:hypothetical protein